MQIYINFPNIPNFTAKKIKAPTHKWGLKPRDHCIRNMYTIFNIGIREAKEESYYQVLSQYHLPIQNCPGDPQSEQSLFPFLLPQMYIFYSIGNLRL